jgi:hypothetical protein
MNVLLLDARCAVVRSLSPASTAWTATTTMEGRFTGGPFSQLTLNN